MNLVFQAIVIGIIQGVTEFIPISSSAHLELAPWIFGWESSPLIGSLAFDVFLHLGTLIALLVYFWRDWVRLVGAVLASIRDRHIGLDADRRLGWFLILGTIPAAIIGFVGEDFIDQVLHGGSDEVRLAIAGALVVGRDHPGRRRSAGRQAARDRAGRPAARRWPSASARRWPCCRASAAPARPSAPGWRWG